MPRFALEDDTVEASEVSETSEMPASGRRRIVVRKKQPTIPPPLPSSEEVALEDILLEAYIEQPQRSVPPAPHTERMISASGADDRAVDELLMLTPSVAPVAMTTIPPAPTKPSSGGFIAFALLIVAVGSGFGAMLVAPHLRKPVSAPATAPHVVTVIEAKTAQPATVPVTALPSSAVEPTMTLVTFPKSAAGHRVYVDDTLIGDGEQRAKIRCGKHTLKIGSQGKSRDLDLPCGRELVLE